MIVQYNSFKLDCLWKEATQQSIENPSFFHPINGKQCRGSQGFQEGEKNEVAQIKSHLTSTFAYSEEKYKYSLTDVLDC